MSFTVITRQSTFYKDKLVKRALNLAAVTENNLHVNRRFIFHHNWSGCQKISLYNYQNLQLQLLLQLLHWAHCAQDKSLKRLCKTWVTAFTWAFIGKECILMSPFACLESRKTVDLILNKDQLAVTCVTLTETYSNRVQPISSLCCTHTSCTECSPNLQYSWHDNMLRFILHTSTAGWF